MFDIITNNLKAPVNFLSTINLNPSLYNFNLKKKKKTLSLNFNRK